MPKEQAPITEFYDDEMVNLSAFFLMGTKQLWNFNECRKLGINKCVFFFPRNFQKLKKIYKKCKLIYSFKSASSVSPVYLYEKKVAIALCPLGGPAAANLMEELIYVGFKTFIGTGSSGVIKDNVDLDKLFVVEKSIRDEGTSYHYLPPSRYVESSEKVTNAIKDVLVSHNEQFDVGTAWTTAAMYRETPKRIKARLMDGATCVDMESASLCSVAKAHGVAYGSLLYFSDYNSAKSWQPRNYNKYELRQKILEYSIEAILKL